MLSWTETLKTVMQGGGDLCFHVSLYILFSVIQSALATRKLLKTSFHFQAGPHKIHSFLVVVEFNTVLGLASGTAVRKLLIGPRMIRLGGAVRAGEGVYLVDMPYHPVVHLADGQCFKIHQENFCNYHHLHIVTTNMQKKSRCIIGIL